MTTRSPSSTRSGIGRRRRSPAIAVVPLTLLVSLAGGASHVQAQEVTVELWTHEFEPLQTAMLEKWIPEFEEAFPEITVEMTTIPLAGAVTYDAKLLASLRRRERAPTCGTWATGTTPRSARAGTCSLWTRRSSAIPMTPISSPPISQVRRRRSNVMVSSSAAFSEFNTLNLFYNREVFADAGVSDLPTDVPGLMGSDR